jgi:nitroimidazol reductase NimA-like FMN-containing flavoprotein (pyridoxamine 5'-phosphate oxidase superfamily)
MFKEMRRIRQQLTHAKCVSILEKMTSGVLALSDGDGYPYAVPLSYDYYDNKLIFHSAIVGHKIDLIGKNDKASFCVIEQDKIVPEKFTTFYRSVIAFGKVRIIDDKDEKLAALERFAVKYSPNDAAGLQKEVAKGFDHVLMLEMTIEHLTGKESIELVAKK